MTNDEYSELVQEVREKFSKIINVMSSKDDLKWLADELSLREHRYLQEELFLNFICPLIENWSNSYKEQRYDARNELTCRLCKDLVDVLKHNL